MKYKILIFLIGMVLTTNLKAYEPVPNYWEQWESDDFGMGHVMDGDGNYFGEYGYYTKDENRIPRQYLDEIIVYGVDWSKFSDRFQPMTKFVSDLHNYDPDLNEWEYYDYHASSWVRSGSWNTCSECYNPLRCIDDKSNIYMEQTFQTQQTQILVGTIYFILNWLYEPFIGFFEEFDQVYYDYSAGICYTQGTLYNWVGTIHYNCESEIITQAELTSLSVNKLARPIEGTSSYQIRTINKITGEINIYGIMPGAPANDIIPLEHIDRDGLPGIGQNL